MRETLFTKSVDTVGYKWVLVIAVEDENHPM